MEKTRSKEEIKHDLKIAWEDWESRPSNVAAALDMEDMCQEAALSLGMTATTLRTKFSTMRSSGLPIDKILTNIFSVQLGKEISNL